jgi:hypothetical protein
MNGQLRAHHERPVKAQHERLVKARPELVKACPEPVEGPVLSLLKGMSGICRRARPELVEG